VATAAAGTWLDRVARRNWLSSFYLGAALMAQVRAFPRASALLIWLSMRRTWMKKAVSQVDVLLVPTPNTANLLGRTGHRHAVHLWFWTGKTFHVTRAEADSVIKLGYIGTFRQSKGSMCCEAMRQLPAGSATQIYGKVDTFPNTTRAVRTGQGARQHYFFGTFRTRSCLNFRGLRSLVISAIWYENSPLVLLSPLLKSPGRRWVGGLADRSSGKNGLLFEMVVPASRRSCGDW
jgi:hypothetical protein